ncbi:S46 family peptidase [Iodobacter sp. HSC-16F04]|uniref:Dipeptidyl-peptidase n=1 Tax=Iodobacter violaceini TaxID=3044271 RepID=A0ABX0KMD8_9NEIS|nr:S46 family peptidase [Iodobacter violacea]NHQ84534.1 S46 family peptidase [Iodobacter violacea]
MKQRYACLSSLMVLAMSAFADEGMWTFDNPPSALVQQRYGSSLSPALLEHLQQSAVNFGASASFVSKDGLMLTNHHVAMNCIDKLSTTERDLQKNGYVAKKSSDELKCPGGMARVLISSDDVSEAVSRAVAAGKDDVERTALRKAVIGDLESKCKQSTALQCEVVSLYQGSLYHLYRFKEWNDVRLAFAPEYQAAFFGGDADNFVYPRFALDFALFRVYENDKPLNPKHYLKMADKPVGEGDAVFVVGHPGNTDRLQTLAQLKALRDINMPIQLASAKMQQQLLHAFSKRSPEAARQALDVLFGTENWQKALLGEYAALKSPQLMARKEADEAIFRKAYQEKGLTGDPWAEIDAATAKGVAKAREFWAVGYGQYTLFDKAGKLVELAFERQLPDSVRLSAYRDARITAVERQLRADVPVYKELETIRLAAGINEALDLLGENHPFIQATLGEKSPIVWAEAVVKKSRINEVKERVRLLEGGVKAIEASEDPLIKIALAVYPLRRELLKFKEEQVETPIKQAAEKLGQARFALYGKTLPPDATGTLRLSYGKAAAYTSNGIATPWKTTIGGLLARADGFASKAPFDLAGTIAQKRSQLDPRVPLNFASTADIIGGNSGSPVVNSRGEWVGLIFDGNLESLGGRFVYTDETARALSVDAQAILYALDKVYAAPHLAKELRVN